MTQNDTKTTAAPTSREQFAAYIRQYLEITQQDYLPSFQSYNATMISLFAMYADGGQEGIDLQKAQRQQEILDSAMLDPQLLQLYKASDRLPVSSQDAMDIHTAPSNLGAFLGVEHQPNAQLQQMQPQQTMYKVQNPKLRRFVAYTKSHPQFLAWMICLGILYVLMCLWMILEWKDNLLRKALGWQLVTAKCGAQMMKLSFMLLPLMVLRGIHTWLENHGLSWIIPKESMLRLHKLIGHTAMFAMLLHVTSHIATYTRAYTGGRERVRELIQDLDDKQQTKILDRVDDGWRLESRTFITGVLLLSFMLTIWLYAASWPRTSPLLKKYIPALFSHLNHYTSFARSHLLYIPIFFLLFIHVLPKLPAGDATHDVWLWISVPIILFALDKLLRTYNQHARQSYVCQMAVLPGRMVALRFARPSGFKYSPGMYVNVRLPGTLQAHPFTLSSAPSDPWLRVHVRVVGDWTGWMHDRLLKAGVDWEESDQRAQVWQELMTHLQEDTESVTSQGNAEPISRAALMRQATWRKAPDAEHEVLSNVTPVRPRIATFLSSKKIDGGGPVTEGKQAAVTFTKMHRPPTIKFQPGPIAEGRNRSLPFTAFGRSSSQNSGIDHKNMDSLRDIQVVPSIEKPEEVSLSNQPSVAGNAVLSTVTPVRDGSNVALEIMRPSDAAIAEVQSKRIRFQEQHLPSNSSPSKQKGTVRTVSRAQAEQMQVLSSQLQLARKSAPMLRKFSDDSRLATSSHHTNAQQNDPFAPNPKLARSSLPKDEIKRINGDSYPARPPHLGGSLSRVSAPVVQQPFVPLPRIESQVRSQISQILPSPPQIFVDGPYASPLAGILDSGQLAIMVASGSGLTPFQGVMREHMHKLQAAWATEKAHREVEQWLGKHGMQEVGHKVTGPLNEVIEEAEVANKEFKPWLKCYNFDATEFDGVLGWKVQKRPQKLVMVWVVRYFEWFTWLEEELQLLYNAPDWVKEAFQLLVFVTQPGEPDPDAWADASGCGPNPALLPKLDKTAKQAVFLCQKQSVQEAARANRVAMVVEGGRPKWPEVMARVLQGKRIEELRKCGVFVCGGQAIANAVKTVCRKGVEVAGITVHPKFRTEAFY